MFRNETFLQKLQIKNYSVLKKFKSKKNEVYLTKCEDLLGNTKCFVIKQYKRNNTGKEKFHYYKSKLDNDSNIEKEIKFLIELREKDVSVPKLYYFDERIIIMEYIEGKNIVDIIDENECKVKKMTVSDKEFVMQIFIDIFVWLQSFYKVIKDVTGENFIFGDVNLRNFIVSDRIYGIDFEDCNIGYKEEDGGKLCAFILTYTPCFSPFKINLVKELYGVLINNFYYDAAKLKKEMIKELYDIGRRRNIDIPSDVVNMIEKYK